MPTEQTITTDAYITGIQRLKSDAYISGTRESLNSDGYIVYPKSTIICDGGIIDNILDEFGSDNLTVRVVSKTFVSEYGDSTETYTDYTRTGMIQRYTANDQEVVEGVFKSGEVAISFKKADENLIKTGNRVLYAGDWYQIDQVYKQPLGGILYYLTAIVQKI